jgi:hypothetical protein
MILARHSSPAPSARPICRTQTKKTKSLTCLRHPLPSAGRGTKPRRGGIFFDHSPAFQGWDSSPGNIPSPVRDERCLRTATTCGLPPRSLPSLAGLSNSPDNLPSHKWLGYYRMMPLQTELDSFTPPFLQRCQSYGLRRLRPVPKRQRTGALQDASRHPGITRQRASVLDCGGPPPLSHGVTNKRPSQNDFGTAFVPSAVGAAYL